jgi:hypothetical protein
MADESETLTLRVTLDDQASVGLAGVVGGNVAAKAVSVAPLDGYTILATTTRLAVNETE